MVRFKNYNTKYLFKVARKLACLQYKDVLVIGSMNSLITDNDRDASKEDLQERLFTYFYKKRAVHLLEQQVEARQRITSRLGP